MSIYHQTVTDGVITRVFDPDVDDFELKWHQDTKNRKVTIIKSGGWKFQRENELPIPLNDSDLIYIQKNEWHRVIKGGSKLIVEIIED